MNNLAFLMLLAALTGAGATFMPLSWPTKIIMYVGVGLLCATSLVLLERFDRKLTEALGR